MHVPVEDWRYVSNNFSEFMISICSFSVYQKSKQTINKKTKQDNNKTTPPTERRVMLYNLYINLHWVYEP